MKIVDAQNEACYGWRWGCWDREERVEGSGSDVRATVPAALQYPRVLFTWWWLGLQGRWGGRPRGFAHGQQERRDFLLISCLIRSIHLLSLYREVYLTPKQGLLDP